MIPLAITQRVELKPRHGERRDALDQRWSTLLLAGGFAPLPVPNSVAAAAALLQAVPVAGVLFTGGNDLAKYGGDAPERDATEAWLLRHALERDLPVLGVCRGMQVIQDAFGVPLQRVAGHVAAQQEIAVGGKRELVNSYHGFGATGSVPELEVWASADDGVVKAVRHRSKRVLAFMWHPERFAAPRPQDLALMRKFFGAA